MFKFDSGRYIEYRPEEEYWECKSKKEQILEKLDMTETELLSLGILIPDLRVCTKGDDIEGYKSQIYKSSLRTSDTPQEYFDRVINKIGKICTEISWFEPIALTPEMFENGDEK